MQKRRPDGINTSVSASGVSGHPCEIVDRCSRLGRYLDGFVKVYIQFFAYFFFLFTSPCFFPPTYIVVYITSTY